MRTDIPHRSLREIADALLGVGWVSLEFVASTIHKKAKEPGLLTKEDAQQAQDFYKERRIDLTL